MFLFFFFKQKTAYEMRIVDCSSYVCSSDLMVDHASRRADDDMYSAPQRRELRTIGLATVDRQHMKAAHMRGVTLKGFGDLDRQFARRRQHQLLWRAIRQFNARQDRQCECGGFAEIGRAHV